VKRTKKKVFKNMGKIYEPKKDSYMQEGAYQMFVMLKDSSVRTYPTPNYISVC
jgi:hypothetical protein